MTISHRTSHREMRISSIQRIVNALQQGAGTKNDILEKTQLSWGSCSGIINLLENKGIICISGKDLLNTRGRKTASYIFNNKKNLLFGMEIQAKQILCSIIDLGKNEVFRNTYIVKAENNINNIQGNVSSAFINTLVESSIKPEYIIGISIAIAGGVDVENKKWMFTTRIKGINNYDLNNLFSILPSVAYTRVEHDIHAQAASVLKTRNWNDKNYIFINIGLGISLSIYSNGLFTGHRGWAGEIGHIPYNVDGSDKNSNIESAITLGSIIKYINKKYELSIKSLEELPLELLKDKRLINYIKEAVLYLIIVASNILDPETIIIGGATLEPFYENIKNLIEKGIKEKAWGGGPKKIKWFNNEDLYGGYGTILNASNEFITKLIEEDLSE